MKRVVIWVDGHVQGVGFRWWGQGLAGRLGLTGTVANLVDGRVEFHVQGPDERVDQMVAALTGREPGVRRPGWVESVDLRAERVVEGEKSFEVRGY